MIALLAVQSASDGPGHLRVKSAAGISACCRRATTSPGCHPGARPDRAPAGREVSSSVSRRAAVEAAHQAWRPSNPWHVLYAQFTARHGKNPAKSAVARKVLIAAWHGLSRGEPFKPSRPAAALLSRQAPAAFWPPDGPAWN
jgi:hypothetical protein